MTKAELLKKVSDKTGVSQADAKKVLAAFQVVVLEALGQDGEAVVLDFGKFKVAHRNARKGVNPRTGESQDIPAKDVPQLKASRKFKDYVATKKGIEEFNY